MTAADDRDPFDKAQDELMELLVLWDEAARARNWSKVKTLDAEIAAARALLDQLKPKG